MTQPSFDEYWEERHELWVDACTELHVMIVDDGPYEATVDGLDTYLTTCGVRYFTGYEATRPWQKWGSPLLPHPSAWIAGAVLLTLADRFREQSGYPIRCRNWYRPEDYNREAAKGVPRSDHIWACAVDLDFLGGSWFSRVLRRRAAQKLATQLLPRHLLSLGVGWTTLHVGYAAPATLEAGRHRRWSYGKLPATEKLL